MARKEAWVRVAVGGLILALMSVVLLGRGGLSAGGAAEAMVFGGLIAGWSLWSGIRRLRQED